MYMLPKVDGTNHLETELIPRVKTDCILFGCFAHDTKHNHAQRRGMVPGKITFSREAA